jgi:hypothetical protein
MIEPFFTSLIVRCSRLVLLSPATIDSSNMRTEKLSVKHTFGTPQDEKDVESQRRE